MFHSFLCVEKLPVSSFPSWWLKPFWPLGQSQRYCVVWQIVADRHRLEKFNRWKRKDACGDFEGFIKSEFNHINKKIEEDFDPDAGVRVIGRGRSIRRNAEWCGRSSTAVSL